LKLIGAAAGVRGPPAARGEPVNAAPNETIAAARAS
jgi:hypothetical protein